MKLKRRWTFFSTAIAVVVAAHAAHGADITAPVAPQRQSWAVVIGVNYVGKQNLNSLKNAEEDADAVARVLDANYQFGPDKTQPADGASPPIKGELKNPNITLLLGEQASRKNIDDALEFLKSKPQRDDSVLFFFSGHGVRLYDGDGDVGAILPADVVVDGNGRPTSKHIRMHYDLVSAMRLCSARHKLIVLDCCHSGLIFDRNTAVPTGATADESGVPSPSTSSLQALVSARDFQKASDGLDDHSPFSLAFLRALKVTPALEYAEGNVKQISARRTYGYMVPELRTSLKGQKPDLRTLISVGHDDGEYYFHPRENQLAFFKSQLSSVAQSRMLQAMVPGEHGAWWFDEMPWFVPSLRLQILNNVAADRSNSQSSAISADDIRELAEDFYKQLDESYQERVAKNPPPPGIEGRPTGTDDRMLTDDHLDVLKLRVKHLNLLLDRGNRLQLSETIQTIIKDLSELQDRLPAADLHLLAVALHHARPAEAEAVYQACLKRFPANTADFGQLAMKSLCHADYGHYLIVVKRRYRDAAEQFKQALLPFVSDIYSTREADGTKTEIISKTDSSPNLTGVSAALANSKIVTPPIEQEAAAPNKGNESKEKPNSKDEKAVTKAVASAGEQMVKPLNGAPAAFRVYALVREAEAWRLLNRWGIANERLEDAEYVAKNFDSSHALTAYVLNRSAWSRMEQWKIEEGASYFSQANEVLLTVPGPATSPTAGALLAFQNLSHEYLQSPDRHPSSLTKMPDDLLQQLLPIFNLMSKCSKSQIEALEDYPAYRFIGLLEEWNSFDKLHNQAVQDTHGKLNEISSQLTKIDLSQNERTELEAQRTKESKTCLSEMLNLLTDGQSMVSAERERTLAELGESLGFEWLLRRDPDGLIRYLHNRHGIAMANRFRGDTAGAIREFRRISDWLTDAGNHARSVASDAIADSFEQKLAERLVNTLERVGDCNLFGPPETCDIAEAIDDYRRALSYAEHMPAGDARSVQKLRLYYKAAVAMVLPSPAQDVRLAVAYSEQGAATAAPLPLRETEVERTLATLAKGIVAVGSNESCTSSTMTPLETLRADITKTCDLLGGNLHRDQLEILLLAARFVLEHDLPDDHFHRSNDTEMLLRLCRMALPKADRQFTAEPSPLRELMGVAAKPAANTELEINPANWVNANHDPYRVSSLPQESTQSFLAVVTYLRPFYETAMRFKLLAKPVKVKELLEIQWEAVAGIPYQKPVVKSPVVGVFFLDETCHIFLDSSAGATGHYELSGDYYLNAIRSACVEGNEQVSMPRALARDLDRVLHELKRLSASAEARQEPRRKIEFRLLDPVRGVGTSLLTSQGLISAADAAGPGSAVGSAISHTTFKPEKIQFPFKWPNDIESKAEERAK